MDWDGCDLGMAGSAFEDDTCVHDVRCQVGREPVQCTMKQIASTLAQCVLVCQPECAPESGASRPRASASSASSASSALSATSDTSSSLSSGLTTSADTSNVRVTLRCGTERESA